MDNIEALHSLAAELKKAGLTVEEAKRGLSMEQTIHNCGIEQADYKDLIKACIKMKDEGFITAAVKLNELEQTTGLAYEEIVAQSAATYSQLKKDQKSLQIVGDNINASKAELAAIDKQKKLASHDLESHMQQTGMDLSRLKSVEDLALALKQAGILSKELGDYIKRQQLLNKTGIDIETFMLILERVKVITSNDGGKELFHALSEYGSLNQAVKALQVKVQLFEKQAVGLEEQANSKGKLDAEVNKLKAEKASLTGYIGELRIEEKKLKNVKEEVISLTKQKSALTQDIAEGEEYKESLGKDIKSREQKVSDLKEVEAKRDASFVTLSENEARIEGDKKLWEAFESFLGLVQSSSFAELEKFAAALPNVIMQTKIRKYSPELLKSMVIEVLSRGNLQLLRCRSCQARFAVDRLPNLYGYKCPVCDLSFDIAVDIDAPQILKAALAPLAALAPPAPPASPASQYGIVRVVPVPEQTDLRHKDSGITILPTPHNNQGK